MQYSIVNYQSIVDSSHSLRLDAEYFQPKYDEIVDTIKNYPGGWDTLGNLVRVKDRNFTPEIETEYKYIELSNIGSSGEVTGCMVEKGEDLPTRARRKVGTGDVIVSSVEGSLESIALITEEYDNALCSTGFHVIQSDAMKSEVLLALLESSIGQLQLKKGCSGTILTAINKDEFSKIVAPQIKAEMQAAIQQKVLESFNLRKHAKDLYTEAQTLLLTELGLTDWQPKQQLTFVKNFSDTQHAERFDADYFQPKYDEIVNAIREYPDGYDTLGNLSDLKDRNFTPDIKIEYKYIELANIGSSGEVTGCMIESGGNLPTRARRKVTTSDVIVSSVEGSLESIALITEEYDNALCSTGFHVIQSDVIKSEVLLVLLKSIVGQLQLKKGCSGTILTAINKDEFGQIAVPILRAEKQTEIQQKVIESFSLRKRAKHLLACATRAVEIAIEQDEQTAIEWLESVS